MPRQTQGSKGVVRPNSGEAYRDHLIPLISQSTFAQDVLSKIEDEGYAILSGVFSNEETAIELDRMWSWVETVSRGIRRNSCSSWKREQRPDPWPCSQRDMMQLFHAGWVFSSLRERFAERVFEPMYGTRELHCSKDGFTFQRPTDRDVNLTPNDHFDQGLDLKGLHCIQGSVALTDQEHEDGCFVAWPGSHKFHEQILYRRGKKHANRDFNILNDDDKEVLMNEGIHAKRVPVKRGDVMLWRSDLCHKGAPPIGVRNNFRAVVYVCCLPAQLTPEEVYVDKLRAYEELQSGSHWPCREEWFSMQDRHQNLDIQPYFKQKPSLTRRQQELYGLVQYRQTGVPVPLHAVPDLSNPEQSEVEQNELHPSTEGPLIIAQAIQADTSGERHDPRQSKNPGLGIPSQIRQPAAQKRRWRKTS